MNRTLLRNLSLSSRNFLSPKIFSKTTHGASPLPSSPFLSLCSKLRFFSSSDNESSSISETKLDEPEKKDVSIDVEDISNKELKLRMEKYFKGDEEVLPSIFEAILKRNLTGKHEDTDGELVEDLRLQPLDDVNDKEFKSDFEEIYETDEEIDDLYNAREIVQKRMVKDEYFNMDDRKWDAMIKEATEKGFLKDTGECERILEDMLSWDKLLPEEIKKKVEEKFNELGDMCERGELEPQEAYELFKEFEDQMVLECGEQMEAEGPPHFDDSTNKKN